MSRISGSKRDDIKVELRRQKWGAFAFITLYIWSV